MFGWSRGMSGCCGQGFGIGHSFSRGMFSAGPFAHLNEAGWLKCYKNGLELQKMDLDAEIKAVEKRMTELEK